MAGHSKWANIKHQKAKADAKKGKIFSRITKEIIVAAKIGGGDLKNNPRLRLAIQKAREANMPNDNIERNIKKALSSDQADYFDLTYELYGYGGVGILVEILTDNKNRIASDMRIATNKCGGTIASPGSVAFNFEKKGIIQVPKSGANEEDLFMKVLQAGAEDFDTVGDSFIVETNPASFESVKAVVDACGFKGVEAELQMVPKVSIEVDKEAEKANMVLIEWLEALDDVDAVYHNMQL